jgi:hypothetical protein
MSIHFKVVKVVLQNLQALGQTNEMRGELRPIYEREASRKLCKTPRAHTCVFCTLAAAAGGRCFDWAACNSIQRLRRINK